MRLEHAPTVTRKWWRGRRWCWRPRLRTRVGDLGGITSCCIVPDVAELVAHHAITIFARDMAFTATAKTTTGGYKVTMDCFGFVVGRIGFVSEKYI